VKIDPRVSSWVMGGFQDARDHCLHVPSFMVIDALQKKSGLRIEFESVIAFLISDLVCQIKSGERATAEEIHLVIDGLLGIKPDPFLLNPKVNVVDLPPRKKL